MLPVSTIIFLASVLLLAGGSAHAGNRISVVATFSIIGDFVEKVGGDRVAVRTLVGPEADAHVYQPSPADAADVAKAKIVFQNGLGFEGWMERLSQSANYKGLVVIATKGVAPINSENTEVGAHLLETHAEREPYPNAPDPHAWQDVNNARLYVANIRDGLCAADAAGCDHYTQNASDYAAALEKLDAEIMAKITAVPQSRRKVITSHDAFGYFAKAYGIQFLSPSGVSTESEASAKDVATLIDKIRAERVTALFVENIADARLVEQIARETGVKVGGTLYSDALSKADGPAKSYIDMMRHNVGLIVDAMGGS